MATEFNVRGFPTIMFLKGEDTYVYEGDRTREDIVAFAHRLMGPPVKDITSESDFDKAKQRSELFFIYVGRSASKLWDEYYMNAKHFQRDEFMYSASAEFISKYTEVKKEPAVFIYKDNQFFSYEDDMILERQERDLDATEVTEVAEDEPVSIENSSMSSWITSERFPVFMKITRGKFSNVLATKKLIVMAVLEENKLDNITPEMEEFREMIKKLVINSRDKYHHRFQFGWTGIPDLANSVAMEALEIPSLLVINSTSFQHHIPQDESSHLTPEAIELFLDSIVNGDAPTYGGNTWSVRLYRAFYEAKTSMVGMWKGNPVLTAVLLGLPFGFLSLIFYSICCADIMDAEDDEDEDYLHEKND